MPGKITGNAVDAVETAGRIRIFAVLKTDVDFPLCHSKFMFIDFFPLGKVLTCCGGPVYASKTPKTPAFSATKRPADL